MSRDIRVALELDDRGFRRGIQQSQRQVQGLEGAVRRLGPVIAGAFAIGAVTQLGRSLTGVYTEFETFRTILTTTLGSQELANAELERMQNLANNLPQDLRDITQAFVTFSRFGLDTSNEGLTAFSNLATASGRSMNQLAEALADAMTGEFERLKEFGIKVNAEGEQIVARFGSQQVAVADTAEELVAQLQELGATRFGDAAEINAQTLSQSLSNLRGAVYETSIAFMEGLAPALKVNVDQMAEFIRQNNHLVESMGEGVGEALRTIASFSQLVSENLDLVRNAILTVIGVRLFGNLQRVIANLSKELTKFGGTARVISMLSFRNLFGLLPLVRGLAVGIARFLGPIGLAITAVQGLTLAWNAVKDRTFEAGSITTSYGEVAAATFTVLSRRVTEFAQNLWAGISAAFENITSALMNFYERYRGVFDNIRGFIGQWINTNIASFIFLFESIRAYIMLVPRVFLAAFNVAKGIVTDFTSRTADAFGEMWDYIRTMGRDEMANTFDGFGREVAESVQRETQGIMDGIEITPLEELLNRDFLGEGLEAFREYAEGVVLEYRSIQQAAEDARDAAIPEMPGSPSAPGDPGGSDSDDGDTPAKRAIKETLDYGDRFLQGWQDSMRDYVQMSQDGAMHAAEAFKEGTRRMEDAILNFVTTGRFEFKSFISDILQMILRSQIQRALGSIFGMIGGPKGGGFSNLFAGFFAEGGRIPSGKWGVVGEAGAELVQGPASVTPMSDVPAGGSTNVYYTINATDARSFRQLVAEDPEFIYRVTQQGARRVP